MSQFSPHVSTPRGSSPDSTTPHVCTPLGTSQLVRETLVSQVIEALLPGGQTICSATPEPVPFHQFVMILISRLQKCGVIIYATLDFIVFIHLNVRQ